jgi:O-antigen biosynthesis protein WbqP
VIKRLFDLCLVLLSGIPAVFLILLAAIFVWIETRVNPFFIQERVGQFGSTFKLLKLRTMAPNTANKASHEIAASQITNTGRFLRRTKIDELPQIWNVLLGDLSFVGHDLACPARLNSSKTALRGGCIICVPALPASHRFPG